MSGRHQHVRSTRITSPAVRIVVTVLAVAALLFSAVALVFRAQPVSSMPRLILSVGSTFVPLIALVGLVLAVVARRSVLMIVGAFLLTATLAIQVSWYYVGYKPRMGPTFTEVRVLSSNLRHGLADANQFVELASRHADVITVAELTNDAVQRYNAVGIGEQFPYSLLQPTQRSGGIGIWSRYPLTPITAPRHRLVAMPAARVEVPGVTMKPLVGSAYVKSPVSGDENTIDEWRQGMSAAKAQLDNFAREAGAASIIIGGDYNSTPDMRQFRDLLTDGYQDSVQQLGSGFAPTFKADNWLPPLITIDHILTRNAAASSIRTAKIKGTDHRAVVATIRVPRDPIG